MYAVVSTLLCDDNREHLQNLRLAMSGIGPFDTFEDGQAWISLSTDKAIRYVVVELKTTGGITAAWVKANKA